MLNHQGTKQIESENLILRKFTIDDAKAVKKLGVWWESDKISDWETPCRYTRN